jgi:hypothetical protein
MLAGGMSSLWWPWPWARPRWPLQRQQNLLGESFLSRRSNSALGFLFRQ